MMAGSERTCVDPVIAVCGVVGSLDADACSEPNTWDKLLFKTVASDQKAAGDALKPHPVNGSCNQNGKHSIHI